LHAPGRERKRGKTCLRRGRGGGKGEGVLYGLDTGFQTTCTGLGRKEKRASPRRSPKEARERREGGVFFLLYQFFLAFCLFPKKGTGKKGEKKGAGVQKRKGGNRPSDQRERGELPGMPTCSSNNSRSPQPAVKEGVLFSERSVERKGEGFLSLQLGGILLTTIYFLILKEKKRRCPGEKKRIRRRKGPVTWGGDG